MKVKEGSKWYSADYKQFTVIHVIDVNGHTWIHYRSESNEPQEYSCFLESFVSRFSPSPE